MNSLGDSSAAQRALQYYDADDSKTIDKAEFLALLQGEGLLTYNLSNTFLWGDYQSLGGKGSTSPTGAL